MTITTHLAIYFPTTIVQVKGKFEFRLREIVSDASQIRLTPLKSIFFLLVLQMVLYLWINKYTRMSRHSDLMIFGSN
jgi:hypothetical protein